MYKNHQEKQHVLEKGTLSCIYKCTQPPKQGVTWRSSIWPVLPLDSNVDPCASTIRDTHAASQRIPASASASYVNSLGRVEWGRRVLLTADVEIVSVDRPIPNWHDTYDIALRYAGAHQKLSRLCRWVRATSPSMDAGGAGSAVNGCTCEWLFIGQEGRTSAYEVRRGFSFVSSRTFRPKRRITEMTDSPCPIWYGCA